MNHKLTHGGSRSNAGRKKVKDKRKQLNIYIQQSRIDLLGGDDAVKELCYFMIENAYKKEIKK